MALGVVVAGPGRRGWYTVHRREVGASLWRDEWFPMLDASHLTGPRGLLSVATVERFGVGDGAPPRVDGAPVRPVRGSVALTKRRRRRGRRSGEFTTEQGDTLEAAVRPAQARRVLRQLWVVSSAPGPNAPAQWLRRYRDRGRASVDAGERSGTLYLEYAAPPDLPYDDPATWALGHPGIAAGHVDPEALYPDLAALDPATFAAEYLGWWAAEHDQSGGIDLAQWATLAGTATLEALPGWVVSVDCNADRSHAAVAVAAPTGPGRCHVEVVAEGPGRRGRSALSSTCSPAAGTPAPSSTATARRGTSPSSWPTTPNRIDTLSHHRRRPERSRTSST